MPGSEATSVDKQPVECLIRCASAVQKLTLTFADGTKVSTVMGPGQQVLLEYGLGPRPEIGLDDADTLLGSVSIVEISA